MTITEAIGNLKEILDEVGDVDVVCFNELLDEGVFEIDRHRVFDIISPDGSDEWVCAFMQPLPPQETPPKLTLVKR